MPGVNHTTLTELNGTCTRVEREVEARWRPYQLLTTWRLSLTCWVATIFLLFDLGKLLCLCSEWSVTWVKTRSHTLYKNSMVSASLNIIRRRLAGRSSYRTIKSPKLGGATTCVPTSYWVNLCGPTLPSQKRVYSIGALFKRLLAIFTWLGI